ncbi:phosphoribosyltransferase family protein [Salinimicrobium sp. MT39]|uniref:Phosphoribosyltransferase family protein n=1 Tax=Salinimicrobium profundisediminis TaxID=2994553 RepID=A0A9X3CXN3_9FLAO|nr:phosphoribosyltransferase family protein [Salinimicrobium profundisediminis]MCX2838675.1 phosphoribosyltransferase family protein [Salinimicrobium profundisediminis]
MEKNSVLILNNEQINHKIRRIAYQIYENNLEEDQIILAGIAKSGFQLAQKLQAVLQEISDLEVLLCEVKVNKKNPLQAVTSSLSPQDYENKALVLIDDVLNSGTTLIYGIRHFLDVPLKRFKTAVLVDRSHKKYPVKADFKGISLSTSIHETVKVHFKPGEDKVELV